MSAEHEFEQQEPAMVRPKPTPIRVADLGSEPADPSIDSSPLGYQLMQRKIERQTNKEVQGTSARPENARVSPACSVGSCDSPGWETNFNRIREADDPRAASNSSPQGAALLSRKIERQQQQLDKPLPRSGPCSSPSEELLKPPALRGTAA